VQYQPTLQYQPTELQSMHFFQMCDTQHKIIQILLQPQQ
jgi:hypothetical protein